MNVIMFHSFIVENKKHNYGLKFQETLKLINIGFAIINKSIRQL
jgi:hypothetical protein